VSDDDGNVNGGTIDDPCVNSAVVGVDMISGDGNDPGNPPTGDDADAPASGKRATGDRRRA
jgi:hypothetical protein